MRKHVIIFINPVTREMRDGPTALMCAELFGPPKAMAFTNPALVDAEWWLHTPAGPVNIYNLPAVTGPSVTPRSGTSAAQHAQRFPYIAAAIGTPAYTMRWNWELQLLDLQVISAVPAAAAVDHPPNLLTGNGISASGLASQGEAAA